MPGTLSRLLFPLLLTLFLGACASPPVSQPPLPDKADSLTIAAVGDVMLGTDFPRDRLPVQDGRQLLQDAMPVLQAAEVSFGNLEGVLLDGGEPAKKCKNLNACYLFRSPTRYVARLHEAGFDVMSLANNHARDFGEAGRDSSMRALQQYGIRHSGRTGDVASWEVNGIRVALVAFAPFIGSFNMLDHYLLEGMVRSLDEQHDIVIVSFHGGAEGLEALHIPFKPEYYYGELRGDVVAFARRAVDAGADLVIGHGPHVPRALEVYRERLIAYSLGNFATYQGMSVAGIKGLAPLLEAQLDNTGRLLQGRIHSYRQLRPRGPVSDPQHEAARLMARLSCEDFPGSSLAFDRLGYFYPLAEPIGAVADKSLDEEYNSLP